ncbi:uncharacterized protein EAF02_001653 [Botrytis sinoallii]|uniref:uncharacterized protein n=1 Tax=Botrytis sinoallii TaxID=1463999 RepID=UPI0019029934|nr:uncharacterized protein EAF02_001653 [Botrytis sinoallii]KAF7891328.1 hypothetical protein EAF02_001653 [Botrytis sinoallii]
MDGLSTAASVIAVVQLAQAVGGALKEYYEGVKSARDDIQRLYHSIKNLESVLKSINDLPHTLSINIQTLLENKTGTLSPCKAEFDGIKKELDTFSKQQNHIGKLKSLIWPFKKKDVDKHVDSINKHKHDLMLAFGVENLHISMHHHNILEDIQSEIRAAQRDKERSQIIEWLAKSLPDPSTEHNIAREKFQKGTGSWLIDGNHLNTWSKTNNSFLWLNGGAGAGKSILCSTVIEHIQQLCKQEINVIVTYWYIKFDNLNTQSVSNIIRSWIRDICSNRRDTPQTLKDAYAHCNHGQQQPTIKQMMEILKSVVTGLQDIYLVVDALDEYPKTERDSLLETLKDIHQWKIDSIHIFVTSRAEDDIRFHLDEMREQDVSDRCQSIRVQDPNITEDIKKFLNSNISSFRQTMWNSDLKEEVVESIARQADGMFRLAALQLDSLKRHRNMSAVRKGLNQLPSSLDIFYERALREIPEEDQDYVKVALQWIAYSPRCLTVSELSEAVVVQIESPPYLREDDGLSCEGDNFTLLDIIPSIFVTTYSENGRFVPAMLNGKLQIQFAHYSVQEFLQSSRTSNGPINKYHLQESYGFESITARCIAYLLHVGSFLKFPYSEIFDNHDRFPLIYHATFCWTYYMQLLEIRGNEPYNVGGRLHELVSLLIKKDYSSSNNQNAWELSQTIYEGVGLQYPCSAYDLALTGDFPEIELDSSTPVPCLLSWACHHGLISLVQIILSNAPCKGREPNESRVSALGTPLHAAAIGSHFAERIVTLLLAAGANPNACGGLWGYPLIAAAAGNRFKICKLLCEAGARLDSRQGSFNRTPLHVACKDGYVELCEYLLENSANDKYLLESRAWTGAPYFNLKDGTPLLTATAHRHLEVVKILFSYGADIEAECDGYTPLQIAAGLNDVQMCKLLLDCGSNVNKKTIRLPHGWCPDWNLTWNPLHQAFAFGPNYGRNSIDLLTTIEILLKAGADIHAKGGPMWENGPMVAPTVSCLLFSNVRSGKAGLGVGYAWKKALDTLLDAGAGNGQEGAELLLVLKERRAMLVERRRELIGLRDMENDQRELLDRQLEMS